MAASSIASLESLSAHSEQPRADVRVPSSLIMSAKLVARPLCIVLAIVAVPPIAIHGLGRLDELFCCIHVLVFSVSCLVASQAMTSSTRVVPRTFIFWAQLFAPLYHGPILLMDWQKEGGADALASAMLVFAIAAAIAWILVTNRTAWCDVEIDGVALWRVMRRLLWVPTSASVAGNAFLCCLEATMPDACRSSLSYLPPGATLSVAVTFALTSTIVCVAATEDNRQRVLRLWQVPLSSLTAHTLSKFAPPLAADRWRRDFLAGSFDGCGSGPANANDAAAKLLRRIRAMQPASQPRGERRTGPPPSSV